jgi:DNA-binding MarR family transcriptional regulator
MGIVFSAFRLFELDKSLELLYNGAMTKLQIEILELRKNGFSYREIIEKLGCSKSTVSYFCGQDQKLKSSIRNRDKRSSKRKLIQELKSGKSCLDCGHEYPHFIMDFDHRPDEQKLFEISKAANSRSIEQILIEVNKCDLVCANCHRYRTWNRKVTTGNSTS